MDAELLLADMEFHDDDSPENIKLKENVLTDFGNREKNIEDETVKYRI